MKVFGCAMFWLLVCVSLNSSYVASYMVCYSVGWNWCLQVHKELRETMAQLEAIRHEMRTGISIMNPGPMTSQVFENSVPGHSAPLRSSEKGLLSLFPFCISFASFEMYKI